MTTRLPEPRLVELRAAGLARRQRFVDPVVIRRASIVLDRRGEEWAAAVLGRDLRTRSRLVPARPALRPGEEYVLVMADAAEDAATLEAMS